MSDERTPAEKYVAYADKEREQIAPVLEKAAPIIDALALGIANGAFWVYSAFYAVVRGCRWLYHQVRIKWYKREFDKIAKQYLGRDTKTMFYTSKVDEQQIPEADKGDGRS